MPARVSRQRVSRQRARSVRCSTRMARRAWLRSACSAEASRAFRFFAGVVDLQRQDGEAVDDQAGRFGVERGLLMRQFLRREPVEECAIQLFGEVVAQLVGAVDAAFDVGELGVGGAGGAGFVFDVPEVEVGAMLAGDEGEPRIGLRGCPAQAAAASARCWWFRSCSLMIASAESIWLLNVQVACSALW